MARFGELDTVRLIAFFPKRVVLDLMLNLSAHRESVQVVFDEVNNVTYAPDLAAATRDLVAAAPAPGISHATNSGAASWYDIACEVFRLAGRKTTAIPVAAAQFPRTARRPAKAVLLNTKLPPLRPWREALAAFLNQR